MVCAPVGKKADEETARNIRRNALEGLRGSGLEVGTYKVQG